MLTRRHTSAQISKQQIVNSGVSNVNTSSSLGLRSLLRSQSNKSLKELSISTPSLEFSDNPDNNNSISNNVNHFFNNNKTNKKKTKFLRSMSLSGREDSDGDDTVGSEKSDDDFSDKRSSRRKLKGRYLTHSQSSLTKAVPSNNDFLSVADESCEDIYHQTYRSARGKKNCSSRNGKSRSRSVSSLDNCQTNLRVLSSERLSL
eukprot:Awhi_evm1s9232